MWQKYLREQKNSIEKYDLVCSVLQLLDALCGSLSGGYDLLSFWVNESSIELIKQSLDTLVEYCQGPCHENQHAIINHETNEIDLIIALIFVESTSLSTKSSLELKDKASKLLLAVLESNDHPANGERIISGIKIDDLLRIIKEVFSCNKQTDDYKQMEYVWSLITSLLDKLRHITSLEFLKEWSDLFEVKNDQFKHKNAPEKKIDEEETDLIETDSFTNKSHRKTRYFWRILSRAIDQLKQFKGKSVYLQILNFIANVNKTNSTEYTKSTENDLSQDEEDEESEMRREVGHNLYILAHKLGKFNKEFNQRIKQKNREENDEAFNYYAAHTAQIEVNILF